MARNGNDDAQPSAQADRPTASLRLPLGNLLAPLVGGRSAATLGMLDFLPMARLLAFLPDRAPWAFMWLRAARAAQSAILRQTGRLKFSQLV